MSRVAALVAILIAITALVVWAAGGSLALDSDRAPLAIGTALLIAVLVGSHVMNWRATASDAVRYTLIWGGLFLALILAYSYRNDANGVWQRITGELNPAQPLELGGGAVVLRRAGDGHFHADVAVNGTTIRMLVDTGATDIALDPADAARAGINVDTLKFDSVVSTANGPAAAANIRLDEVRIGQIVRKDVRASVSRGLSGSLLGLSFLDRLKKYSSEGDQMVLQD
jgi:aspartyl protease family protein